MRRLVILGLALLAACPGGGGGAADAGTDAGPDAGAQVGEPCPDGRPDGCAQRICLTGEGGQTYCSAYCLGAACPKAYPCQPYLFGQAADIRAVCAPPCQQGGDCHSGTCESDGRCAAPVGTVDVGGACGAGAGTCLQGLVCTAVSGTSVCIPTCAPGDSPFCPSGALCWGGNVPDGGVCWPGGEAAAGGPCTSHLECPQGHLCIGDTQGSTCRAACDPAGGAPVCAAGVCTGVPERAYGFCLE